jgi:hypothetical protein
MRFRMSRRVVLAGLLALLQPVARPADAKPQSERIPLPVFPSESRVVTKLPPQKELDPKAPGLWFPMGETLEYKVYWGVIPVAISRVTTTWEEDHGRKWIVIRFRTVSNETLSKLYPVNDTIESWVDPETFLPFKFNKRLNEGRYKCDETTLFDHIGGKAYFRSNTSDKRWAFTIKPDTRDIPSFMYFMRKTKFEPGQTLAYELMADEKLYDLIVKTDRLEKIKLPKYGKVDAVKCVPEAAFNGIFVRKGKMTMWVTSDERRVCVQMEADTPFANVRLKLQDVSGPGEDPWIKNKKDD